MKARSIIILLVILFVLVIPAISQQKASWKGTVEYENGVEVIKNPNEPQYGEITFELVEDLLIEDKDGKDYFFQWICDVNVDSDGKIYVLDRQQHKAYIFDKLGNYIKAIGGKGQGPGEFNTPTRIVIDGGDRINVLENRRLHLFDNKADFVESINFSFFVIACSLATNGEILVLSHEMQPSGLSQKIVALNPQGKKNKTIAENIIKIENLKNPSSSTGYGPMLFLSPLDKENSIYWNSAEYRLFLINSSGRKVRIIEKDELLKRELYLTRMFTIEDGIIFVKRGELESEKRWLSYFDIFNTKGHYIYKAYTNGISTDIIKKGYIYTLEMDSDTGAQSIKRHKIENWDQIKKSIE